VTTIHVFSDLLAELAYDSPVEAGALASSSQPAIEPTCYSALALDSAPVGDIARAQDFLLASEPNAAASLLRDDQEVADHFAV